MSALEYEHGSISLSKSGYAKFAQGLRKLHNDYQDRLYREALKFYEANHPVKEIYAISEILDSLYSGTKRVHNGFMSFTVDTDTCPVCRDDLYNFILQEIYRNRNEKGMGRKLKPRKNQLPKFKNTEKEFSFYVSNAHVSLHYSEHGCALNWQIQKDWNCVSPVYESRFGEDFISYLEKYNWKRNEGGCFYYWSEYDEEARSTELSISRAFGPVGERARKERNGF